MSTASTQKLEFDGKLLERGFWLYIWEIKSAVGNPVYYVGRTGLTVVLAASPKFQQLAENSLENRRGYFNATPTFDDNRLLLRSNRALYCLGK